MSQTSFVSGLFRNPPVRRPKTKELRLGRVKLRYEQDVLSSEQAKGFVERAARGILAVEELLGLKASRGLIRFEIRGAGAISFARERTIHLPAERVRSETAPYLHELAHALAPCLHAPPWFCEGFACYVECAVAERGGGYDSHLFTANGNAGVDTDAARWLADARGRAVLPFVGARGMPRRIVEDRHGVAAPFYVLSHSLIRFLAERWGIAVVARLARTRRFTQTVRRETGRTMSGWREAWLDRMRGEGATLISGELWAGKAQRECRVQEPGTQTPRKQSRPSSEP